MLRTELSQGDVFEAIPIVLAPTPVQFVRPQTFKGSVKGWILSSSPFKDSGGRTVLFAAGFISLAIAISHDCEFEDQQGSKNILCARVELLSTAPPEHQPIIARQQNIPRLYLPALPGVGDCYANLRSVATVDRQALQNAKRVASMSSEARDFLQARLVQFFLRREFPGS